MMLTAGWLSGCVKAHRESDWIADGFDWSLSKKDTQCSSWQKLYEQIYAGHCQVGDGSGTDCSKLGCRTTSFLYMWNERYSEKEQLEVR